MRDEIYAELVRATGEAILALVEPMEDEHELFESRNTLAAVEGLLLQMARALERLPERVQARLRELDWYGWQVLHQTVLSNRRPREAELWYAINALVPATLTLLARKRAVRTID